MVACCGLIRGYYIPRWKQFLDDHTELYPTEPTANSVQLSARLFAKWDPICKAA